MPGVARERRRQLLDVERDAVRALVQHGHDVVVERLAGDRLGEPRGVLARERPQRDLDRLADPAQLGAQAAQAVRVGRHLVAREPDQQQRRLAQTGGDAREQQQRRLVGPVEIVEHDGDRAVRGHLGERAPQRLDQRRLPGIQGRDPELRAAAARDTGASGPQASATSVAWRRHWRRTWATGSYGWATDERAAPP